MKKHFSRSVSVTLLVWFFVFIFISCFFFKEIIAGYWNHHVQCDNTECFDEKSAFVADFPHINYLFSKLNYKIYHFYSPGLKSLYLNLHQFINKVNKGCQIR